MLTFLSVLFLQVLPCPQPAVAPAMNRSMNSSCDSEHSRCDLIGFDLSSREGRQIERAASEIQQVYPSPMKPLGCDSLAKINEFISRRVHLAVDVAALICTAPQRNI